MPRDRLREDICYWTAFSNAFRSTMRYWKTSTTHNEWACVNWSGLYPLVLFRIILVLDFLKYSFLGYRVPSYISCFGPLTSVFVHVFVSHTFSLPKQHKQGSWKVTHITRHRKEPNYIRKSTLLHKALCSVVTQYYCNCWFEFILWFCTWWTTC